MSDHTDVSPATQAPLVPAKCLLTAQQAAERLQVPLGTVRAWLRHGWPMPKPWVSNSSSRWRDLTGDSM